MRFPQQRQAPLKKRSEIPQAIILVKYQASFYQITLEDSALSGVGDFALIVQGSFYAANSSTVYFVVRPVCFALPAQGSVAALRHRVRHRLRLRRCRAGQSLRLQ